MLVKFWDLDTQHCFLTLVGHKSEVSTVIGFYTKCCNLIVEIESISIENRYMFAEYTDYQGLKVLFLYLSVSVAMF